MSRLVVLDTAVLGFATSPNGEVNNPVLDWLRKLMRNGDKPYVPEIADYELRRELIRVKSKNGLARLDGILTELGFLPLDTETMHLAAALWADARNEAHPFAHEHALDGDVILLAQSQLLQEGNENDQVIIATTNVKHLSRYADASEWQKI